MEPNGSNNKSKVSGGRESFVHEREVLRRDDAPRHDLKIIIAKKPNSKSKFSFNSGKSKSSSNNNKGRLNKPNSNSSGSSSKILNDFERLRGNVDNFTSSEIACTSGMKTTLSKKTGTVSHHDLKFENKSSSNTKRHNNNDSHDFYEFTMKEEREKEKQKRESMKHTNSSSSLSVSSSHSTPQCSTTTSTTSSATTSTMMGRNDEKFKVKSSLSKNIPKLKIELPSLKTKITVPKTPNESYSISKSPFSNNAKCEPQIKKVRFDMTNTTYSSSPSSSTKASNNNNNRSLYDFNDDESEENSFVDQKTYAEKIGLKPVERKVESIILHRKRKKSKHSKEISEHSSKRPKHVHVSSSLDESLKLKLKIMGGKNCKNDKKINEDETYERTCNLKAVHCKTADLSSINVHEVKQHKKQHEQQERRKDVEVELENQKNHKYSVTEQKITKTSSSSFSDSIQPMVFIPKLVLQKATTTTNVSTFTLSTSPTSSSSTSSSYFLSSSPSSLTNNNNNKKEVEKTTTTTTSSQVQRRNSILSEHKLQQERKQSQEENKWQDIKIKIKPLDKLAENPSNQKLMKPPTAKMGSPSSDIQAQISSTFASSPIRPNSIPASLKLSPISPSTYTNKNDFQNFKRSLSTGAETSPHCYINPYAKSNTEMFTREPPLVKIPPLIPTSQTIRNIYSNNVIANFTNNNDQTVQQQSSPTIKQAPVTISKVPNINVKDPIKLFPNACPSVEILKIPQAAPIVNQQPVVKNIKLNRPMPPTIPLFKIKETAQNSMLQKILPKSNQQQLQNLIKMPKYSEQKISLPLNRSNSSNNNNNNNNNDDGSYNSDNCQSPISQTDLSLARYHFELSKDIAKLDHSLSLEKNFEDWMKKQEFSKLSFAISQQSRNIMSQQMNLSVRNIPNPSALMMFRNQNNNLSDKLNSPSKSPSSTTVSSPSRMVTSTTTSEHPDIEEVISKSTISKGTEKPFFSENNNLNKSSSVNNHSKINDKKSIEKLTEYLRLTATAAKSKEIKNDDDNNNNNNSPSLRNDKNFNLIDSNTIVGQKSSSMDVICIDT